MQAALNISSAGLVAFLTFRTDAKVSSAGSRRHPIPYASWPGAARYTRSLVSRAVQLHSENILQEEVLRGLLPRFENPWQRYGCSSTSLPLHSSARSCNEGISVTYRCKVFPEVEQPPTEQGIVKGLPDSNGKDP